MFSDISTPSSPPSSPPAMSSLDQQLREVLDAINGLTQRVKLLTNNLDTLQAENRTLHGQQRPTSVRQPAPFYPMQGVWANTPAPQPLPRHSPPRSSGSHPLPTPPHFSPSHVSLPQTPPA